MNIFSNIGITELLLILLLALLVVGPERLPELARQLGKTLRNIRKAYENMTRDLGPELMSIQQTTQELRESVESVRSIPQDMVKSVVKAANLDETVGELREVANSIGQVGQDVSSARKVIQDPMTAAVGVARSSLLPTESAQAVEPEKEDTQATTETPVGTPEEPLHE